MNNQSMLPIAHRYYLAIMAVSCYNCEYLIKILEEQFVLNEGDPQWLAQGILAVDPKLRVLATLNQTLAHKPWIIDHRFVAV